MWADESLRETKDAREKGIGSPEERPTRMRGTGGGSREREREREKETVN